MQTLITAISSLLPDGVPAEIVFIPAGEHRITPQSHPKGILVKLPDDRGEAIASAFNDALQKRRQQNVQPWFDFEHTRRFPAAGYPTAFRFEAGKGIIATVEWSASGSKAIEGRDVRYFSPEFFLGKDGVPSGIPDRGPLGGLVTEPAFREIPPVAASDAEVTDPTPPKPSMKLILAALGLSIPDTDTNAEQHAVTAINALKETASRLPKTEEDREGYKTKLTAAETTIKSLRTKQGEELFDRAVAAGLVEKDNADEKASYIAAAVDGNEFAIKLLGERITAAAPSAVESSLAKPLVTTDRNKQPVAASGKHAFEVKAEALVTAKAAADLDEAFGMVAASEPNLYGEYCSTLTGQA